jgi:hypothetical protein
VTAGLAPGTVTSWLNTLATGYAQAHTGDPGAAGTANPSAVTTRQVITYTASTAGSPLVLSNAPTFAMTATELITHISVWSASTGGTFQFSGAAQVPAPVNNGDTVVLNTLNVAILPQAA